MLEVRGATRHFGGITAVNDVDLQIPDGEIHCIIGPNGAGKTTFLSLLTGEVPMTSGEVWLDGERLDELPPYRIARLGVLRKFQVPAVFDELTVRANLNVAAAGSIPLRRLFAGAGSDDERVESTLRRINLEEHASTPVGELPHGLVQWVEIGMVLINEPRVILLDEPTAGMTRAETEETADLLTEIAEGTTATIVVVEHDMDFVRRMGERITVLHEGTVLVQGSIDEIENDPVVREVYLGTQQTEPGG